MKRIILFVIVYLPLLFNQAVSAEIAVIVHPNYNGALTQVDIKNIFLGKIKKFPNGKIAIPVTQTGAIKDEFNAKVLSKSGSQMRAYWSKLIFTGKSTPPKRLNDDSEVVDAVSGDPSIVGYVNVDSISDKVKVVLIL